ncbi:protein arginine N-methyltransferase [Paenibacillus xylaniclasticus]|uniref:protein arginine N-methyltransferase n=1 Tax=Paenibacillus xylaniclasticus TaxID=588083 RepID=UPI001FE9B57D|nr:MULTISPECIES: FkbM family methyltransferase [Paenibacillus]
MKRVQNIQTRFNELLGILSNDTEDSQSLQSLGQFINDEAISIEDVLFAINNTYTGSSIGKLYNNLGAVMWELQSYDYVIPLMQQSLMINPKDRDTLYNLGYVLHVVGEHDMAMTYLESIEHKSDEDLKLIEEVSQYAAPDSLRQYQVERFDVPNIAHPVYVRLDTSDRYVFKQIFELKEYHIGSLPFKPKFIIDGGANVGYASLWFANAYPDARIVAIEPEQSNYDMIRYNTRPYEQIKVIQSGLWHTDTYLTIKDVGLGKWGTMVEESDKPTSESFKAVTIQSILESSGFDEIDILKIDIEGAEKEVFSKGYENWLGKVKVLIIELHDRMKRGCSQALFAAISKYDFAFMMKGENIILVRGDIFYRD